MDEATLRDLRDEREHILKRHADIQSRLKALNQVDKLDRNWKWKRKHQALVEAIVPDNVRLGEIKPLLIGMTKTNADADKLEAYRAKDASRDRGELVADLCAQIKGLKASNTELIKTAALGYKAREFACENAKLSRRVLSLERHVAELKAELRERP